MSNSRAAIRYAKAILDLAVENKATDAVEKDMRSVVETFAESQELREMLASPVIKGSEKKQALTTVFAGGHSISEGLIGMLVDNKRVSLLNEVAEKYSAFNIKCRSLFNTQRLLRKKGKDPKSSREDIISLNGRVVAPSK